MLYSYTVINWHDSYNGTIISCIPAMRPIPLLPFLSEKHICILFLIKLFVLVECIDIKWLYKKQVYITHVFYIMRLQLITKDVTKNNNA